MATNINEAQWLNYRYAMLPTQRVCFDRPGILLSDSTLDRSTAIELILDSWDKIWDNVVSTSTYCWLDHISIECLLVMELVMDRNVETQALTPKGDLECFLKKDASNSDIRYVLTVFREQLLRDHRKLMVGWRDLWEKLAD